MKSSNEKRPCVPESTKETPTVSLWAMLKAISPTALALRKAPISTHLEFLDRQIALVPFVVVKITCLSLTVFGANSSGELPKSNPLGFTPLLSPASKDSGCFLWWAFASLTVSFGITALAPCANAVTMVEQHLKTSMTTSTSPRLTAFATSFALVSRLRDTLF